MSERAKRQRTLVGIPVFLLLAGVLVLSSVRLAQIGSNSVFFSVCFGTFVVLVVFSAVDLLILDWLVFVTLLGPRLSCRPAQKVRRATAIMGFTSGRFSKAWRGRSSVAS
jgi:hypothetical protein